MIAAATTAPYRLVLPLSERVLVDRGDEMTPVRLLVVGEFAWLISGVLISLVSVGADGATVELVSQPKDGLTARHLAELEQLYGNIDVPTTITMFYAANPAAVAMTSPELFREFCTWMDREKSWAEMNDRQRRAGLLPAVAEVI